MEKESEYCQCENPTVTTDEDDFGYWLVCCKCGKHLEGEYHYYNHFDGEDQDDGE